MRVSVTGGAGFIGGMVCVLYLKKLMTLLD
jgi:nucleoside-diphosphate-sugar epimerase